MKKTNLLSLVLALLLITTVFGDVLKLHEGESMTDENVTYRNDEFDVSGQAIERENVKKIIFGDVEKSRTESGKGYKVNMSKIQEYMELAGKMEKDNPGVSGIIFLDYGKSTLTSDDRILWEYHFAGKVLAQESKHWGNLSQYIDEGINRVHILYARSVAPDSTVVGYSPEDITYSEPTHGSRFFSKGEIMSLTIPGVEVGSIVEYGYIIETYAPEDPELFSTRFFFQNFEPCYRSKCLIEIPKGKDFYYMSQYLDDLIEPNFVTNIPDSKIPESKITNPTEPEIIETDSSTIYSWELMNVPPMISEPSMMSYMNVAPGVFGALYKDFSYYNKRFRKIHGEHAKITPQIDSLAKAIVGNAESDTAKIALLYHWMQQNIRYISVKGALASRFGGHFAQITLDNKYGDCSDKAILFATLLKVVGIEAYPIILMTNNAAFFDRSIFPFWGGNHAINEVWWDGKPHVLDATNNFFRFPYYPNNDADIWYANYVRGEIVFNPPIPPEENSMCSRTSVKITSDGTANISDSLWFTGQIEAGYRGYFEYTPEERHKQILESYVSQRKAGAILDTFSIYNIKEIDRQFVFEFDYRVNNYLIDAGNYMLLEVPALRYSFPEIALRDRKYGIKLEDTYQRRHDVILTLPDDMNVEFVPGEFNVSNQYFDYSARYEKTGNGVHFVDEFSRKKLRVPLDDCESYKADVEKLLAYMKERVFLSRK